jgi:XRE family transcriptional regulator, aerobic/anaerobic benzoate catabolism transcriptional regulator
MSASSSDDEGSFGAEPPPIIERLAEKVRARRRALSLTLRELSEHAGVSQRFLVLLEGAQANISVVRLDSLARALGTSASELLADSSTASPQPSAPQGKMVALLGLRGAGKTTIGTQAAARLEVPFIELDRRIVDRAGISLGEIFELHGMDYFRRIEREELDRLLSTGTRGMIATSGSVVTDHATFGLLRRAMVTIWLSATPEDHWNRVIAQGDARPMANRADAMRELKALLRARRALYELADHVVDTSALGLDRSVDSVVKIAREACSK